MFKVVKALETGAANSWALANRSDGMINNNYPLGFKLSLHHKDLSIAIETAEDLRAAQKELMWSNCTACHSKFRAPH